MKISVIIPAYNEQQYLGRTLEAVFAQKYPNFEVIVVDNGSTDNTAAVAGKFPLTVVRENRHGTQWAMESGRQRATGEIIVRLDADSIPYSGWLKQGAAFFADRRVVAVTGPYDYYDAASPFFRKFSLRLQKILYFSTNWLVQTLGLGAIIMGGNSFMRAATLEQIKGFDTSITFYGDDTDVAKRLARVGRVVFDNSLVMQTSARRLASQGVLRILSLYIMHFFKVIFSGL